MSRWETPQTTTPRAPAPPATPNATGASFVILTYTGADPVHQPWTVDTTNAVSSSTTNWTGAGDGSTWDSLNWDLTGFGGGVVTYDDANNQLVLSGLVNGASKTPIATTNVIIDTSVTLANVAVIGPAAPTTIASLTVGDTSGVRTTSLTLQAAGDLNVTGQVTVNSLATLDASAANITGQRLVNSGNTTLVSGAFTQDITSSAGSLTLNGTATAATGINVTGGTLAGTGTISNNLNYSARRGTQPTKVPGPRRFYFCGIPGRQTKLDQSQ